MTKFRYYYLSVLLLFLINFKISYSYVYIDPPKTLSLNYTENYIRYEFPLNSSYFSNWTFYLDRVDDNLEYMENSIVNPYLKFKCFETDAKTRICEMNTTGIMNRFYSVLPEYCVISNDSLNSECGKRLNYRIPIPKPYKVNVFSPPTSGGNVLITGYYLRIFDEHQFRVTTNNNNTNNSTKNKYNILNIINHDEFSNSTYDITKMVVSFNEGSGGNKYWYYDNPLHNENNIPFTYAAPKIDNIIFSNQSVLLLNGTNFSNNKSLISIKLNGNEIDLSNFDLISNHTLIEIKNLDISNLTNNHTQRSLLIDLVVDGLKIADSKICYNNPIPNNVENTFIKSKGGILKINSSSLSSFNYSKSITIKVGSVSCEYINSTSSKMYCNLPPISTPSDSLFIKITIDGCTNTNNLVYKIEEYEYQHKQVYEQYGNSSNLSQIQTINSFLYYILFIFCNIFIIICI